MVLKKKKKTLSKRVFVNINLIFNLNSSIYYYYVQDKVLSLLISIPYTVIGKIKQLTNIFNFNKTRIHFLIIDNNKYIGVSKKKKKIDLKKTNSTTLVII